MNHRPQRRDLWASQSVSGLRLSNECGVWIENTLPTLPLHKPPHCHCTNPHTVTAQHPNTATAQHPHTVTAQQPHTAIAHTATAHSSAAQHWHCHYSMYTAIVRAATATASNQHLLLQLTSTWMGFLPPRSSSGAHSKSSDAAYDSLMSSWLGL